MGRRQERVGDLILQELGTCLQREIRDPRIGFATFSRIKLAADFSVADVFVSILGSEKEERDTLAGLISSSGFLRKHLAKTLPIRTVPKLKFIVDRGPAHSERIEKILKNIDLGDEQ